MAGLDSVIASLNSARRQLSSKQDEKQGYLVTAERIKAVYDRLADDKRVMKSYRDSVKTFSKESFTSFQGNLYKTSYMTQVNTLIADYNTVISNIDTNMDRLNTERARYENMAYQCNGTIGYLQSVINSLVHIIQNWVN